MIQIKNIELIANFNRINICGSPGAGKSTVAKYLSKLKNLPLIDLDDYYYHANCIRKSKVETIKTLNNIFETNKNFVIDGTYINSLHHRFQYIDLLILIDQNTLICLYRFLKRLFVSKKINCGERLTKSTFRLLLTYNLINRPKIIKMCKERSINVAILKNNCLTFTI